MGCVNTVGSHKQNCKIEKSKTKKKGGRMETNKKKWKVKKMKQSMKSIGSCICFRTGLWHREVLEEIWIFVCGLSITYVGICIGWVRLGHNMWGSGGVIEFVVLCEMYWQKQ